MRVEITVVITFVRVNITLRVEITLVVWKLHSSCVHHTRACVHHTRECVHHTMHVNITHNPDFLVILR
jgi:hypothetical protein